MFLLKLAVRPWKLAPYSQIFSALAVGLLLLLAAFLHWMQFGLRPVLKRLQHEQVITAFIDPSVEKKNEAELVDTIRSTLGSQAVSELNLVDANQFVSMIQSHYPELGRELETLGSESESVIPRYISISGFFSDSTLELIRGVRGIESADSSKDRYRNVLAAFAALKSVARVLVVGLLMALLTGLIHLARTNSYIHQDAVALMKLWGASFTLQKMPELLSGILVGMLGGAVAGIGWITIGTRLSSHIRSLSPLLKDMASLPVYFPFVLILVGGVIGLIAGWVGAFFVPLKSMSGRAG